MNWSKLREKKKAAYCKSVISLNLALFLSELPLPPLLPQLSQNERHRIHQPDAAFISLQKNRGFPPFRPYTLLIYHGSEYSASTRAGWHFLFAKEDLQLFRNNSSWRPSRFLTGFQTCKIKLSNSFSSIRPIKCRLHLLGCQLALCQRSLWLCAGHLDLL